MPDGSVLKYGSQAKVTPVPPLILDRKNGMRMASRTAKEAFKSQNLLRTNPFTFESIIESQINLFDADWKTIRDRFKGEVTTTTEGISAWQEAFMALDAVPKMRALVWSDELALAADDHCEDMGQNGMTGHTGSNGSTLKDRVARYGTSTGTVSENLIFGQQASGQDYILSLYIDDGMVDRPHRKNLLSTSHTHTGIAHCQHKTKGAMLVIVYAH